MLYLLEPPATLKWINFPPSLAREAVQKYDADLGDLEWRSDTERQTTHDSIRVALRYGIKCSRGLVVDAIHLIDLDRPQELRRLMQEAENARAGLTSHDELMEQLMPGWKEAGRRLEAGVDEAHAESVEEAEAEAASLLAAPADPDLVDFWRSMGGIVPNPV